MKHITQSGRSIVEMLGTLAIMGILSIGGIVGYNYAMSKHRANQVLQDIRLVYQELKYPNTVHQIVSEGSFPDIELDLQSPYEYDFDFANPDDFDYDSTSETLPNLISVIVSGVPQTACDILLKTKPEYVLMLKANGQSVWTCDKSENELSYIFEITTDSLEYGTCSVCTGEHCFDDKLNCSEGEDCRNDICTKCDEGYVENKQDKCAKCDSFSYTKNVSKDKCYLCDGTIWGDRYNSGWGEHCVKCGSGEVPTTEEECNKRCGHVDGIIYMYGRCFIGKNFSYQAYSSKSDCDKMKEYAENVIFYPKDAAGKSTTGTCAHCWSGTNEDKTACTCPSGKFWNFLSGAHAQCRDCTEAKTDINTDHLASKIECDKCPNRYYNVAKGGNDRNGSCPVCPAGQVKDTSPEGDGRRCVDKPAE